MDTTLSDRSPDETISETIQANVRQLFSNFKRDAAIYGTEAAAKKILMGGDILGEEPRQKIRQPHPWLHPTKGWRQFARPAGTNRRRRLIPAGAMQVPGSHQYRKLSQWPR